MTMTNDVFERLFDLAADENGKIDRTKFRKIVSFSGSYPQNVYHGQEFFPDLPIENTKSVTAPFYKNQPEILQDEPFNESKARIIWPDGKSPSLENNPTKEQIDATSNIHGKSIQSHFIKPGTTVVRKDIRCYDFPDSEPFSVSYNFIIDDDVVDKFSKVELSQRWNRRTSEWNGISISDGCIKISGTYSLPKYLYGEKYSKRLRFDNYNMSENGYDYTRANFIMN
jgi:hypothetical protein